jgi:hypothetical protein
VLPSRATPYAAQHATTFIINTCITTFLLMWLEIRPIIWLFSCCAIFSDSVTGLLSNWKFTLHKIKDPFLSTVAVRLLLCHRPGVLMFNYSVAYTVADPVSLKPTPAGQALATALTTALAEQAPHLVLPVLLASSRAPVVADFSQGESNSISFGFLGQPSASDVRQRISSA